MSRGLAAALIAVLAIGSGCTAAASARPAELTVLGAASLREALVEAAAAFERSHPGTSVTVSTDSSAALRTQVEQGAPADVFLSADMQNAQALADGGFAIGDPVAFARNDLTIVVPRDNPAGISSPAELARPGVRIVAAGDDVPITQYATEAVDALAGLDEYPAGFETGYAANIVSREDNVRAVLAKIELGEGDAAIVYATDARTADGIVQIPIPPEANVTATYAGIVVAASGHRAEAQAFLDSLIGADGRPILVRYGFLPPP